MLIPKNAFPIDKVAAKEKTRYALSSVLVERKNGKPRAVATDGRRYIVAEWEETDPEGYPEIPGADLGKKDDSSTMFPLGTWAKAKKAIPKSPSRPVLRHAFMVEGAERPVIGSTDLETVDRFECRPIEGHYPNIDDVRPKDLGEYRKIHFDPTLMAETLKVVTEMVGKGQTVTLYVPEDGKKCAMIQASGDDLTVEAGIMPVEGN
jgi:hypothetical protein